MRGSSLWRWRKPVAGIAFTGDAIVAVKGGAERRPLPEGLLKVSPTTPNIQSLRELAELADEALSAVGARREPLALALPDLAVTTAVLSGRGRASERELRHELGSRLPYALAEARYDFWRGPHGEVLAAAVRGAVARQYEEIVEALDCRLAWVDAVSLVRIPVLPPGRGLDVDLQLYPDHYALTVFRDGELVDVRTKLRTHGNVESVCREVLRVPALHADDDTEIESLRVCGDDASSLAQELESSPAVREVRIENDDLDHHLQSTIELLLARGNP